MTKKTPTQIFQKISVIIFFPIFSHFHMITMNSSHSISIFTLSHCDKLLSKHLKDNKPKKGAMCKYAHKKTFNVVEGMFKQAI